MKLNFVSYLSRDKGYKSFIVHIVFHEGLRPIDLYASPAGSGTPVISTGSRTGSGMSWAHQHLENERPKDCETE